MDGIAHQSVGHPAYVWRDYADGSAFIVFQNVQTEAMDPRAVHRVGAGQFVVLCLTQALLAMAVYMLVGRPSAKALPLAARTAADARQVT
jgi:hypothetical protein